MAKPKIKHTITKKEWNKKHKDFKTTIDGTPYIMMYDDKIGTYLTPVKIVDEAIDENFAVHMAVAKAIADQKVKNPETKKDVKATTALKDKNHPAHKQAKSLFQRIKDRIMGEGADEAIEEMDLNDPIMMKLRAAQMRKNKQAAKKIDTEKQNKNATKIKALKKKRAQVMRDMEQEAEMEGGPIADRYGKLLNRIDNDIIKLGGNPMSESVVNEFKKLRNRKGDVDGLMVTHNGKEYELVYSADFTMGGAIQPYGIVMPGDDVVSFLGKDKKAKSIWKQLKPKVDKFLKSNESVNEAYIVIYAKKKGEKPAQAAFSLRGSALSFERDLKKDGYITMITQKKVKGVDESVNEANAQLNKKVKKYLDDYLRDEKKNSPEHQEAIMLIMRGALTDANFHSEARQLSKYFPKAKGKYIGTPMEDVIEDKGIQIAKWAKWDGYDIIDAFGFYTSMSIGGSFGAKFQSLKNESKKSVNEASDLDVYHKSYTHAIEAAEVYARKKGYEIDDDEKFTKVGMNSKRPSVGKTTRVSLELLKNGKPQRKMLHIQVYGMKNGYELNAYIN